MLVISRWPTEEIVIAVPGRFTADGNPLELRIIVNSGRTKLAFDGPKSFVIWRKEVLDARRAEAQVPTVSTSP